MSFLDREPWSGSVFTGKWGRSHGGDAAVVEPATGAELGRVGIADASDVATSAATAAAAQRDWARTPYEGRATIIRRAARLLEEHAAEIKHWLVREAGSVPGKTEFEMHLTIQMCYEAASLPSAPYGQLLPTLGHRLSMTRRVPAGVVVVIAPFNVPTTLAIRSVAPALALGNAVILKPDPRTAVSGGVTLARVFEDAGVPPGVFHMLPGDAAVGEALIVDPHVRVVSFTGSTAAGRRVGELAGAHLKRAHLELGGNSALVVFADADLDRAVSAGAWGSFLHQGQICMTTGRHLVESSIADEYVERLAAKANALPIGDPAQEQVALGPVIDHGQRDKIHRLVSESVDAGARLAAGGTYDGLFYRPTVLGSVTPQMPAYSEEVFGPVAPVISFESPSEAARLAAETGYGLSLGVLSANPIKALELADLVPSGIVHINDQTIDDEPIVPFGGVGNSGNGSRFGGPAANIEAFTETQWVTVQDEIPAYPF